MARCKLRCPALLAPNPTSVAERIAAHASARGLGPCRLQLCARDTMALSAASMVGPQPRRFPRL